MIFVYKKPTETNLAEYADNIFKNSVASVQSTKWIDVAEQKGYQVTASVDYSIIYTFIINGDYLYEINVINPDEESLKTYDNLLGSFRFTE